MLTLKTAIEKINEYEEENYKLQEQIEFFQRKSQRLEKRNKEIYDGFMATTQELCDTTKELNNYKSKFEKAIEHIKEHQLIYTSQYEEESNFDNHLLDILKGGDEE